MESAQTETTSTERPQRERCYGCFRPKTACFCAAIPSIDNRTDVLILQHVRERFHPFNTARMVHRALRNSTLLVDQNANLAAAPLPLKPRAGLLYPGPGATLLSDLLPDQRPEQLVILDGTWHHAKTLVRDIPSLHGLPCYGLAPASPGRYRIRREPTTTSLSTVEAVVAALRALEPETVGLDQLLEAFDSMIEGQLAHPKSEAVGRRKAPRNRPTNSIPRVLVHDLDNIVVAYGESACGMPGCKRTARSPIYWVAQRLGTGECFTRAIRPDSPLTETFLGHLELTEGDFVGALAHEEFRTAWSAFLRPTDTIAVFSRSTARLLMHVGAECERFLVLKSIRFQPERPAGTLGEILAAEGLLAARPQHAGRAGKRLANAVALAQRLSELGRVPQMRD